MSLNIAVFRMHASASLDSGIPRPIVTTTAPRITSASTKVEETKRRMAKVFDKKEFSISTYDTAWVAMAPSPFSSEEPCFPDCLSWLLENQCDDGSWAQPHHHSLLKKDVLSSTLASILALNKWGLGQDQIKRGLYFLESNFGSATDDSQISPVGFGIIFPAMLDEAIGLPLNLRLEPRKLKDLMNKRDLELKRCSSDEVYLAYIGEGMGNKIQHWESVMKYQRRNGSLFNSPSTTAAAYTALRSSACLSYLNAALTKFGNTVPAVYPLDIYSQLCTVDNLQRLGISRYVSMEIQSVLDETYRCWVQGDEEIFMDALTCALAFRILRMNGYDITSHQITKILEHSFSNSIVHGRMMDMNTALELYKASEFMLHPHETDLERQHLRLRRLLEQESSSGIVQSRQLGRNVKAEVKQALDFPFYAIVERMATRKAIEHYNFDNTRILKTSYFANYDDKDLFSVAVKDYNECQAIHVEELRELNRWFVDNRLDELTEFARHKCAYCYFTIASTLPAPELSDARMSWAKNTLMASVVDDLFDVEGSVEESNNLIELLELWDVDVSTECCSHNMKIIFSALKSTIRESGDKGSKLQGRDVTKHIISIWLDLLHSEMQEIKWLKNKITPTFDEYMSNAYVSAALGPVVLPTLYLVGPKLSEEMVNHAEYLNLFKTSSTCCRLLNDIRVDEREVEEGKVTALSLYIAEKGGGMTREAAIREIKTEIIDPKRRELLRLVLDSNSFIPKPCKELFWNACSNFSMFYSKGDGFWAQEFIQVVNQIINQPISTTKSDTSVGEDN